MSGVECPFCGSQSIQAVPITQRQVGDAVVASLLFGIAAGVAAGQRTEIVNACLNCGRQWIPGKSDIDALRDAYGLNGELGAQRHKQRQTQARRRAMNPPLSKGYVGCVIVAVILMFIFMALGQQSH